MSRLQAILLFVIGTCLFAASFYISRTIKLQSDVIVLLNKKIQCLEQGRVYAFGNYCVDKKEADLVLRSPDCVSTLQPDLTFKCHD